MSFVELSLICIVALLGPALAARRSWHLPLVLGELIAGVVVGKSLLGWVDSDNETLTFLADLGFALMMFVAGTHVPMRDRSIRDAVGKGAFRMAVTSAVAAALGIGTALLIGSAHAPLYVVLMASSSAALVLPIVDSLKLTGRSVLELTAQVALADVAAIVALPLAIDPANAGPKAIGAFAVAVCALVLWWVLRHFEKDGSRRRLHSFSEERKFALELRIQLSILFALAGLAVFTHVSVMLSGFAFGLAVSAVGEPRRLARQLFALNDGFLGPVFFVWLGASIDLRQLGGHPQMVVLGLLIGGGAVVAHAVSRMTGLPLPFAIGSAAQLGVPVAAATIGRSLGVLAPGEDSALLLGALLTIGSTTAAASWAAKRAAGAGPAPGPAAPADGGAQPAQ
ncbi:Kef-type K+ transport system membrane component KefB [Sinomonas atrocyanea]|uniref:cation:proton antiporter n=1 Tax=Sinomonas atrocyanea TaxID=37927 RepID=UPI002787814C|nr:cation:proton antiporter [Sinomonas atrocyanea]MDP9882744.1 Kef-type K+ transport system membrane component KefB [Sinomonas atrocyanea]